MPVRFVAGRRREAEQTDASWVYRRRLVPPGNARSCADTQTYFTRSVRCGSWPGAAVSSRHTETSRLTGRGWSPSGWSLTASLKLTLVPHPVQPSRQRQGASACYSSDLKWKRYPDFSLWCVQRQRHMCSKSHHEMSWCEKVKFCYEVESDTCTLKEHYVVLVLYWLRFFSIFRQT